VIERLDSVAAVAREADVGADEHTTRGARLGTRTVRRENEYLERRRTTSEDRATFGEVVVPMTSGSRILPSQPRLCFQSCTGAAETTVRKETAKAKKDWVRCMVQGLKASSSLSGRHQNSTDLLYRCLHIA
jgi:hypothetical protein